MQGELNYKSYGYLNGVELHGWDGQKPLIVFDGVCVLCSSFIHWVLARDREKQFLFTTAQSSLGQALYRHFELNTQEFETNLVIVDGQVKMRMQAFFLVCRTIGYPWRLLCVLGALPNFVLDWVYERIKRNRYAVFGKRETCMVPGPDIENRFIL